MPKSFWLVLVVWIDPFLVGPGVFVLTKHIRPLFVLWLQVLGVPIWMTQV